LGGALLFITAFMAYFITNIKSGVFYDGLGRILVPSPVIVRLVFGEERLWPGWIWFIIDMVVFWGTVLIGIGLIHITSKIEEKSQKQIENI
jgi:hypothetical protein